MMESSSYWGQVAEWILKTSWEASLVIAVVATVTFVFDKWLTAGWRLGLWMLVIVRLVMPILPPSGTSLLPFTDELALLLITAFETVTGPLVGTAQGHVALLSFGAIWLSGALITGFAMLASRQTVEHRIHTSKYPAPLAMRVAIEAARQELALPRKLQAWMTPAVGTPAVFGLSNPVILLPPGIDRILTKDQLHLALLHELSHIRRRDLTLDALLCFIAALHWFNPLIWWCVARIRVEREMACDESVLRIRPWDYVRYAHTLLALVDHLISQHTRPCMIRLVSSRAELRRRIDGILNFRGTRPSSWLLGLGLALATIAVSMTDAPTSRALGFEPRPNVGPISWFLGK